jgi:YidC/Oxa1 family membrane protein insertase
MGQRYVIAMILLVAFMIFYPWYIDRITPDEPRPVKIEELQPVEQLRVIEEKPLHHKTLSLQTQNFLFNISENDGSIRKIALKDYKTIGNLEPLVLIDATDRTVLAPFSFQFRKIKNGRQYQIQPSDVKVDIVHSKAVITEKDVDGIEINREILEYEGHIKLRLSIKNTLESPITLYYTVGCGEDILIEAPREEPYVEIFGFINQALYKAPHRNAQAQIREKTGPTEWVGIRNRYFCIILKPNKLGSAAIYSGGEFGMGAIGIRSKNVLLRENEEYFEEFKLYVGPLNYSRLERVSPTATKIATLGVMARMLLATLNWINSWAENYGVAIIFLTIFVSIILSPLSIKSAISMRKMQGIQPKIKQIQEKHKKNPQKMNAEIMEIYKKHKVNPLGGCLPMLLQIPVFFALYQVLVRAVELRGAEFLWIRNLATPDKAFTIPFSLPIIGNYINILPFLVIVAMYIQQILTSQTQSITEPSQKIMLYIMPLILGFTFYSMPSGFILYFLVSTLMNSGLQIYVLKKHGKGHLIISAD